MLTIKIKQEIIMLHVYFGLNRCSDPFGTAPVGAAPAPA